VLGRFPGAVRSAPPAPIVDIASRVSRLFAGERVHFADVAFDLSDATPFERAVYDATLHIPHGETRTYGEIARALGQPGAARAVGRALGRNPVPILIPCHRVLAANGRSGGFSAPGGAATKLKLLRIENARRGRQPGLFDE
jgi:methylated-DNA-[protein]-cysteine S-methyltransferase